MKIPKDLFGIEFKTESINFNNADVKVYEFGNGENKVLLLPPFPAPGIFYIWILKNVNLSNFKFITLDMPGWAGLSNYEENVKPNYNLEIYINLIEDVIKLKNLTQFSLIGYSFGGGIALNLNSKLKSNINKLVLISPVFSYKLVKSKLRFIILFILNKFNLSFLFKFLFNYRFLKIVKTYLKDKIPKEQLSFLDPIFQNSSAKHLLYDATNLFTKVDWQDKVSSIDPAKTQIFYSVEEPPLFETHANFIKNKFKDIKITKLKGAHEDFMLKPNEEIINQIIEFIK